MDVGDYSTIVGRAAGYRDAIRAAGLDVDPDLIIERDWLPKGGERALDHLLSLHEVPTAIFATNDYIAYSLIDAAEARGIVVPRDLSVVGHGNLDQFSPRKFLTSVDQPFESIGRKAARLLMHRLSQSSRPTSSTQHIIIETPLLVRKSCSPPARQTENRRSVRVSGIDVDPRSVDGQPQL
jgi:DNA-binding LacI/PurR family transcriptional regulator